MTWVLLLVPSYISRMFPHTLSLDVNCKLCKPSWLTSHRRSASMVPSYRFLFFDGGTAEHRNIQILGQKYTSAAHRVSAFKHANFSQFLPSARFRSTPPHNDGSYFYACTCFSSWSSVINQGWPPHLQKIKNWLKRFTAWVIELLTGNSTLESCDSRVWILAFQRRKYAVWLHFLLRHVVDRQLGPQTLPAVLKPI